MLCVETHGHSRQLPETGDNRPQPQCLQLGAHSLWLQTFFFNCLNIYSVSFFLCAICCLPTLTITQITCCSVKKSIAKIHSPSVSVVLNCYNSTSILQKKNLTGASNHSNSLFTQAGSLLNSSRTHTRLTCCVIVQVCSVCPLC